MSACETLQIMLGFIQTIVSLFIALNDRANKKQPLPVQGCGYFLSSSIDRASRSNHGGARFLSFPIRIIHSPALFVNPAYPLVSPHIIFWEDQRFV